MPTTVHLVRHAAHGLLDRVLAGRMPGVPLSAEGRAQAAALAEAFRARPLAAVLASPVQRAQETAAPIARACGCALLTEPGFDELDFGAWQGAAFATLDPQPEWRAWNAARSLSACPGGESMVDAQARALAALRRACAGHPDAEIAVVSHLDILRAVLAHLLGTPLDLFQRLSLHPASRSTVVLSGGTVRVEAVNLPP